MKKILSFILFLVVGAYAVKCSEAMFRLLPAMKFLNHDYTMVKDVSFWVNGNGDTTFSSIDTYKWIGASKKHELDSVLREKLGPYEFYVDSIDVSKNGSEYFYEENGAVGQMNRTRNNEPYFTGTLDFSGDTVVMKRLRLTDSALYDQRFYLSNDTMYWTSVISRPSKPGTPAYFYYTNDPSDEGLCLSYEYKNDSLKWTLLTSDVERKTFRQLGDTLVYTEFESMLYFLPNNILYGDAPHTTGILRNIKRKPNEKSNGFYDLKGRLQARRDPYRVLF